jgi:hypothetical protein
MTPKEKAEELINKFTHPVRWKMGQEDIKQRAKQCALICCNEVLGYMGADRGYEFWTEVKQEVNYPTTKDGWASEI